MSVDLTINGVTYPFPETGDTDWGPDVTDWATAVTSGMLQKAGGTFQLLAEVDFGTAFGIKSLYYKSRTSNTASSGQIRLARADVINWRNEANDGNLSLSVSSSDNLQFDGSDLVTQAIVDNYILKSVLSAKGALISATASSTPQALTVGTNGYVLTADSSQSTGLKWAAAGAGDVIGPASSTDNSLARFDGTTGKLLKDGTAIVNADISASAAIAYSKLSLSGSIVNADINSSAGIAYSKLALTDSIVNADIASGAAIAFSKLASLTSGRILVGSAGNVATDVPVTGDVSLSNTGVTAYSAVVPKTKGGTGADNSSVTFPSSGTVMTSATTFGALGLGNVALACSVNASALTIELKQSDGASDPSSSSPSYISFRNNTLASGAMDLVAVTSATSVVVPSGATLGLTSGTNTAVIYVYAVNISGVVYLGVNSAWLPDQRANLSSLDTSSDSALFSAPYVANIPGGTGASSFRMIGRLRFTSAPNGTYSAVPLEVVLGDMATLRPSTSGNFSNLITFASGTKTSGASGNYLAMTTNSLTLQPGFWRVTGMIGFGSSGTAGYTSAQALWAAANGGDSSSLPAGLPTATGVTIYSEYTDAGGYSSPNFFMSVTGNCQVMMPEIILKITETATFYLVPRPQMTTPANSRVTCAGTAIQIS